jgi:ABC-type polysaccharide/polyol phosphate transport system ATPase subunit
MMVLLAAEEVSLTFPLYSRLPREGAPDAVHDARVLRDRRGRFAGVKALDNVSIELRAGDRLALIGSNGSGKTTLLQVLAGILEPDSGSVLVEGRATNLINFNVGVQEEATGHRNITLRGLAFGRTRKEIEQRRADIAAFSELGEFLHLPVQSYSAGMRMRLFFAIATAFKPEILLLDEWISAGDESFRVKASDRMASFVGGAGILVLASHNRHMLELNCNKALWLDAGRAKMLGHIGEVFDRYSQSST